MIGWIVAARIFLQLDLMVTQLDLMERSEDRNLRMV